MDLFTMLARHAIGASPGLWPAARTAPGRQTRAALADEAWADRAGPPRFDAAADVPDPLTPRAPKTDTISRLSRRRAARDEAKPPAAPVGRVRNAPPSPQKPRRLAAMVRARPTLGLAAYRERQR